MANAIYNWEQIKKEYFTSPILEVFAYTTQRFGANIAKGGSFTKNTTGWTEQKKAWIKEQEAKALHAYEEEKLKKEKEIMNVAVNGERQAVQIAYALMSKRIIRADDGQIKDVSMKPTDLKTLIEIFRLTQNKPMTIAKTDNVNVNKTVEDLVKELQSQNATEEDPNWTADPVQ